MNEYSQWAAHKSAARALWTAAQQEKNEAVKHFLLQYFYEHSDAADKFINAISRLMYPDHPDNESAAGRSPANASNSHSQE